MLKVLKYQYGNKKEGLFCQCQFSRKYVLDIWCCTSGNNFSKEKKIFQIMEEKLKDEKQNFDLSNLKKVLKSLCNQIGRFWTKNYRNKVKILNKHKKWVESLETIQLEARSVDKVLPAPSKKRGRPAKEFLKSSERTKRR